MIDENNYISRLKHHDESALEYIVRKYGNLYKSEIYRILQKYPSDYEDCLNEALMKIWDNINRYDETKGSFPNWSLTVVRFTAVDYIRRRNKDQAINSLDAMLEMGDEVFLRIEDRNVSASIFDRINEDGAEENYFSKELMDMLAIISPKDRKLFLELYVEELSLDEISQRSGIKKSVLYNRISRAKKRIRERRDKHE